MLFAGAVRKVAVGQVNDKVKGGIGKAYQLFGEGLWPLLDELNEVLAA